MALFSNILHDQRPLVGFHFQKYQNFQKWHFLLNVQCNQRPLGGLGAKLSKMALFSNILQQQRPLQRPISKINKNFQKWHFLLSVQCKQRPLGAGDGSAKIPSQNVIQNKTFKNGILDQNFQKLHFFKNFQKWHFLLNVQWNERPLGRESRKLSKMALFSNILHKQRPLERPISKINKNGTSTKTFKNGTTK